MLPEPLVQTPVPWRRKWRTTGTSSGIAFGTWPYGRMPMAASATRRSSPTMTTSSARFASALGVKRLGMVLVLCVAFAAGALTGRTLRSSTPSTLTDPLGPVHGCKPLQDPRRWSDTLGSARCSGEQEYIVAESRCGGGGDGYDILSVHRKGRSTLLFFARGVQVGVVELGPVGGTVCWGIVPLWTHPCETREVLCGSPF